jgi:hypothetical protein
MDGYGGGCQAGSQQLEHSKLDTDAGMPPIVYFAGNNGQVDHESTDSSLADRPQWADQASGWLNCTASPPPRPPPGVTRGGEKGGADDNAQPACGSPWEHRTF